MIRLTSALVAGALAAGAAHAQTGSDARWPERPNQAERPRHELLRGA